LIGRAGSCRRPRQRGRGNFRLEHEIKKGGKRKVDRPWKKRKVKPGDRHAVRHSPQVYCKRGMWGPFVPARELKGRIHGETCPWETQKSERVAVGEVSQLTPLSKKKEIGASNVRGCRKSNSSNPRSYTWTLEGHASEPARPPSDKRSEVEGKTDKSNGGGPSGRGRKESILVLKKAQGGRIVAVSSEKFPAEQALQSQGGGGEKRVYPPRLDETTVRALRARGAKARQKSRRASGEGETTEKRPNGKKGRFNEGQGVGSPRDFHRGGGSGGRPTDPSTRWEAQGGRGPG